MTTDDTPTDPDTLIDTLTTVELDAVGEDGWRADGVADLARLAVRHTAAVIVRDPDTGRPAEQRTYSADGLLECIDLERIAATPAVPTGHIMAHTVEGLCKYAERHVDGDRSTLWLDLEAGKLHVVLDDHGWGAPQPGRRMHRVTHVPTLTLEAAAWLKLDGQLVSPDTLADMLDDYGHVVTDPDGATMLEVARTFHATQSATFHRATSDASGSVQFGWESDTTARAGRSGDVAVPERFAVTMRLYDGTDPVELHARLRYRLKDGQLRIGYRFQQVQQLRRDALVELAAAAAEALHLDVIEGTPGPELPRTVGP